MQTVHLLQRRYTYNIQRGSSLFPLPVHPHPGVQNVTNSTKNVLLVAKAMASVVRNCCGETHQQDPEGWDTSAQPSPPLCSLRPNGMLGFCFFTNKFLFLSSTNLSSAVVRSFSSRENYEQKSRGHCVIFL